MAGRAADTLIPDVRVRIKNERDLPFDPKADLISVNVFEDVNVTGMFTFTLVCWDSAEMRVRWIDDDFFTEGNDVEIDMGYRDSMETLFKGEITGLEPQFPNAQPPVLTVRGYDKRHRLMGKRRAQTFLKMKDSDIANQIAGDWSLTPEVEDTRVRLDYVLQHNQTDFEFLQERARRIGYEMVVTDSSLHFRPRKSDGSAVLTLSRDVELLDFSARLTTMGQVEEVNVQGWNAKDKKEVVAKSSIG